MIVLQGEWGLCDRLRALDSAILQPGVGRVPRGHGGGVSAANGGIPVVVRERHVEQVGHRDGRQAVETD